MFSNTELVFLYLIYFILIIVIFAINKVSLKSYNIESEQFLPEDEIHYLRQIFYLLVPIILIFGLIATLIFNERLENYFIVESILSTASMIAILYKSNNKILNLIMGVLLIPAPSIFNLLGGEAPNILIILHCIGIILGSLYLLNKFREFTIQKELKLVVVVFVVIITSGLFITAYSENAGLLNTVSLVSNAFTSNGYTIVGTTLYGKLTNIYLVWGGYLLSGVGTATLTAGILNSHFKKQKKDLEELKNEVKELKELKNEVRELKELLKERD